VISVTIDARDVLAAIERVRERISAGRVAYEGIGASLKDNIRLGFVDSMSPYGETWLPLKYRIGQPLVDTGRLRDSITHQSSDNGVSVGTNVAYAAIHQFGGMAGRKKAAAIPARPYMPIRDGKVALPDDWRDEVVAIIKAHISS